METVGPDAVVPPQASGARRWRARRRRRVEVGAGVRIGREVVLRAEPGARLVIGDGVALGDGARLEACGGALRVGAETAVGEHAMLAGAVEIGRECVVGAWARAEGHARLGDRARLAAHAVALSGARLGAGAVVGSYAVVDGAVAPRAVVRADDARTRAFSGREMGMAEDRTTITLSDLVRRATAIVDAEGVDDAVTSFYARHEDDDVPVRGILDGLEERLGWGADEDPSVVMAQAVVLYLAHRLDEVDDDPDEILALAARSEFDGRPPESVEAWLTRNGIEV
jgi:carbonic anhydrase/acetyltransferase-like protein (isoleucine patch superfamily)